jgi:hypothetical protein
MNLEAGRWSGTGEPLARALVLIRSAIDLLDECGAPRDLGANLDMVAVRLEELTGTPGRTTH